MNINRAALPVRQTSIHLCILPRHGLPELYWTGSNRWCSISKHQITIFRVELDQIYMFGGRPIRDFHVLREDPI